MEKPRGTKDYFGKAMALRIYILDVLNTIATLYHFSPIETPIFEHSEVFNRAVGEQSDIVTKEMFTFNDRGGRELTLRPEATASVMRAVVEHKLYLTEPLKLFYQGPMFRYENPQKGRYRQFTQFGIEVIAQPSLAADLEVILLASSILNQMQIKYELRINSLGDAQTRARYLETLRAYFKANASTLSEVSQGRIEQNPLRIFDDKIDGEKIVVKKAPTIEKFYSPSTADRLAALASALSSRDIPVVVDHKLVRGLDYYTDLTFEFVSTSGEAGAQSTLIGGGRYENLLQDFGGPARSGIGFALGLERIANELLPVIAEEDLVIQPDVFVLNIAPERALEVLEIVTFLRDEEFITDWNIAPLKIQKALAKADASGAHIQVIVGERELDTQILTVKLHGEQYDISLKELIPFLSSHLESVHEKH